ncbi:unnamed protein product [Didymodactylos carnosus]|uniref:Pentapeptide repeat-containing protein n=1 Tax=Didymodactylos carnosus TaxID=1234261 RepID=A0A8S2DWG2_9BILA|nr:unnamed protein product [Didymodactylos carnosus]CAF3753973.1 unnamed protein product [Didymodactylos carnosus]
MLTGASPPVEVIGMKKSVTKQEKYFKLTFNELLSVLCAAAVPIAIGVYAVITTHQQTKLTKERRQFDLGQAAEQRQQEVYDQFINDMYTFDKDGQLNDSAKPWAFANARHWAAHQQWDVEWKVQALLFLKKKDLIGRQCCRTGDQIERFDDIIRLNELNFDNMHLKSQTGELNPLNMKCVRFDQVSMTGALFSFVNLAGASFDGSRLNGMKFEKSSFVGACFNGTELHNTDFSNSNLQGAQFDNVDLSTAKLTQDQLQQGIFQNTIMPNGTASRPTTSTISLGSFERLTRVKKNFPYTSPISLLRVPFRTQYTALDNELGTNHLNQVLHLRNEADTYLFSRTKYTYARFMQVNIKLILKLIWSLVDQTMLILFFVDIDLLKAVQNWMPQSKTKPHGTLLLINILHNIARHDAGAEKLNNYGAILVLEAYKKQKLKNKLTERDLAQFNLIYSMSTLLLL